MIFEDLPTTPTSEELLDKAFSRAARAGRAKSGVEAQESMLQTASNVLSDNLGNVVTAWPDFDEVDPFYRELADAVVGVDEARTHLSEVTWASRKTKSLGREYIGRLPREDADAAKKLRKQAFARMGSVLREIEDDLQFLNEARDDLKTFPDIRPDEPAIVVAGYPNVGKSSFVNAVTSARNETARYPFTTKGVRVGHIARDHIRYQLVDTPGLLDRPADERNDIEEQAVSALTHLADAVLFVVDASATCGYPLDDQLALQSDVRATFVEGTESDIGFLTVCNKSDLSTDVEADAYMSVETGEGVDDVLTAAIDATGYEPELPTRD
ncbi:nucleolar GTP-binding protein [Halarchaeum rubridurum]|uniref:GTP-binding protein n=1 Tax=Halarchaeum rubridurum TaxID=489911 RepID=A0A830G125_9EURY|nr:NOG1 family protein [Halarchaeum rubridurum]MBP1954945.1 nucleolar GTP-binding protein [Halarchaeum rubridurum]GGM70192.1 GTP-binding protein [Halarchaeum rubridurum]